MTNLDPKVRNAVQLMKDISGYGFNYLQNSHFVPAQMTDKQVLVMAYFTHAQAHFDGVVALVCKPKAQPATAHLQTRALQETWINMRLMVCTEDNTWSSYLYVISEYERMKVAKWLFADKQIEQAQLDRVLNEANLIAAKIRQENPLPKIKGIVDPANPKRDYYGKQPLNLREKCQLIDYYEPPAQSGNTTLKNYDLVYKYLSKYTHQDARTVVSAVKEKDNEYTWDIGGDALDIQKTMSTSYAYYSGCLRILTDLIGNTDTRRYKLFDTRFEKYLR